MASKSTSPKFSAPDSEQHFKIFCDERTPRRSSLSTPGADFDDANDENSQVAPTFKFVNKSSNTKTEPSAASTKRAPLTDVTQKPTGRPRSFSAALAEISRLNDELETSKDQNRELKGEIVAYQDALHQADVDKGL